MSGIPAHKWLAVLSGVKINGSNTRLLYWCHGVDGRFVLQESELEREKKNLSLQLERQIETVFAALN